MTPSTRYPYFLISIFFFLTTTTSFAQSNLDIFFKNDQQYKNVIVTKVISADTIALDSGERIRLIGIKSPEFYQEKKKIERDDHGFVIEDKPSPEIPIEQQAFEFAQDLLEGKHVRLEFDSEKKNDKFQTFAYVFLLEDGLFVNAEIIRQGYANLQIQPPNTKYEQELRDAYREARTEQRGLQSE